MRRVLAGLALSACLLAPAGVYTTDGWPINAPGCCYGNAGFATLVVSGAPDTGGGVPEPATWTLMMAGFAGAGAMLRRRRTRATFAAA